MELWKRSEMKIKVLKGIYRVQIGLYRNFSNAQYVLNRAVADGYEGNIVYKDPYYAVQIGGI